MRENIVYHKSFKFAVRVVSLYKYLNNSKKEYILSKQMIRSGISIGANIKEALQAQSRRDFLSKMNIALKEASETEYWLELLFETGYISNDKFSNISNECKELNKILASIVRTTKITYKIIK